MNSELHLLRSQAQDESKERYRTCQMLERRLVIKYMTEVVFKILNQKFNGKRASSRITETDLES